MMTREEVAEILHYCKTKGITRKERLKELGIAPWKFYEYKVRYAAEEMSGSIDGAFLQLAGSSEIVPMPSFAANVARNPSVRAINYPAKH